jgi:hypothetical protein
MKARNHYLLIVFDSCRYDSFVRARPRTIGRLGTIEQRWSYASWTSPSHFNFLTGLLPHESPKHVYASDYYTRDFLRFNRRLGGPRVEFQSLVPKLYLPSFLKETLGYETHAMVSLPVLNPHTILNQGFDSYTLMPSHNDMRAMVRRLKFPEDRPSFHLLNVGETHYPYALPDEPPEEWPRISGVHGVFRHLDAQRVGGRLRAGRRKMFDQPRLEELRQRQVRAVRYLDSVMEELFDLVPKNTYITVTADHGELFGEDGYFGHGPIQHNKVFEVPFVEGKLR